MIPMRGTRVGCCAYAATGHAAAAPPNSLMDWRLVTWSMGSPPEPAVPAYRALRLPWKHRQVLGLDLNCSESRQPERPRRWLDLHASLPMGMPRCPSLRKIFLFRPSSGLGINAGYALHGRVPVEVGEPCTKWLVRNR